MQTETPQEFSGFEGHLLLHIAMAVIFPRKSNHSIIYRFYPVIGNSYFVGVTPQVFYHLLWSEKRLFGIHHPFMVVEFFEQFFVGLVLRFNMLILFEQSHEDFAVLFAQGFYRIQISGVLHLGGFCQLFPFTLLRGTTRRNNAVQMGMKANILSPGVKYSNVSALCPEVFWVIGKQFEG